MTVRVVGICLVVGFVLLSNLMSASAFQMSKLRNFKVVGSKLNQLRRSGASPLRLFSSVSDETNAVPVNYKVGFMFPGQGAQTVGMGSKLAEELPQVKALYDTASGILGYDLLEKCTRGPKEELDSTVVAQVAIFVTSMAALEKLKITDPKAIEECSVAMGLSLGEYSALCFAGAFSFEDGVRITKARGEAMQQASDLAQSGMATVIGCSAETVIKICNEASSQTKVPVFLANYLVDGSYTVSGGKEAINVVTQIGKKMGAKLVVPLAVAGAFHTDYMQPAVSKLSEALRAVTIKNTRIPVISNVHAGPHKDAEHTRQLLARQVTAPVQWEATMRAMLGSPEHLRSFEVGPGTVCKGIVKKFEKPLGKVFDVTNVTP